MTFINIFADQTVSVSIFALREGCSLPIHDHPDMYGFIKCIHGSLSISSYSSIWEKSSVRNRSVDSGNGTQNLCVGVTREPDVVLSENSSQVAVLQPEKANIHSVTAVGGAAAFIDFLSPPYMSGERDCRYFTVESSDHINDIHTMRAIKCPSSYWCATAPYCGPEV